MNLKTFRKIIIFIILFAIFALGVILVGSAVQRERPVEFVSRGASLFPFNNNRQVSGPVDIIDSDSDASDETPEVLTEEPLADLEQVSEKIVTGFAVLDRTREFLREYTDGINEETGEIITKQETVSVDFPVVRFNDRATGYIYETELVNGKTEQQLTQTLIPGAREVVFDTTGENLAMRFINETSGNIETFVATIPEKNINDNVCRVGFLAELKKGDKNTLVEELQLFLNYVDNKKLSTDGSFGSGTEKALKEHQEINNLEVTGILDQATRASVNGRCRQVLEEIEIAKQSPVELDGGFLLENTTTFIAGPEPDRFLHVFTEGERTFMVTGDHNASNQRQVFSSPFSEWLPEWVNSNTVVLTTKASGLAEGFAYSLNTNTGALERLLGNEPGLTTLTSPNAQKVLYSRAVGSSGVELSVLDRASGGVSGLALKTLAEKCVWSKNSIVVYCAVPTFVPQQLYPDSWYKGQTTFSDALWRINTETQTTELLVSLSSEAGESIDVVQPALNPDETHLFFVNKNNGTLWGFRLQ